MKPVVQLGSSVLDGTRRLHMCQALGVEPRIIQASSKREAARAVWVLDPWAVWPRFSFVDDDDAAYWTGAYLGDVARFKPRPRVKSEQTRRRRIQRIETYVRNVREGLEPLSAERFLRCLYPDARLR